MTTHFPFFWPASWIPVDDILSLNIAFRSGTISRKSYKHTPLHITRFQRYAGESDLGVILPPPLVGDRMVNKVYVSRGPFFRWRICTAIFSKWGPIYTKFGESVITVIRDFR